MPQVHFVLRDLIRQAINETVELKRFPTLQAELANAATKALEAFRDDSKKLAVRLVDMEVCESSLLGYRIGSQ